MLNFSQEANFLKFFAELIYGTIKLFNIVFFYLVQSVPMVQNALEFACKGPKKVLKKSLNFTSC